MVASARIIVVEYVGDNVGDVLAMVVSAFLNQPTETPSLAPKRETERLRTPLKIPTPERTEPISVLQLDKHSEGCLQAGDATGRILLVGDLIDRTVKQVLSCPNMGPKSLAAIKAALAARGLSLRE